MTVPIRYPIALEVDFYLLKPKSVKGREYPIVRPDLDNFLKSLIDGMKCLWVDDSQIISITAKKLYHKENCIEVRVKEYHARETKPDRIKIPWKLK